MKKSKAVLRFLNGTYQSTDGSEPAIGEPWVYVLIDTANKKPLYVAEVGSSQEYNLIYRLRCSMGELKHPTLCQIHRNAGRTGFLIASSRLDVYCYLLSHCNAHRRDRRSVESWIHWLITVRHKVHHEFYFGFSYHVPDQVNQPEAIAIYDHLSTALGWTPGSSAITSP